MTPLNEPFNIAFAFAFDGDHWLEASGIAHIHNDGIVLEYQTSDPIIGVVKSGVKTIRLPIEDIARVRVVNGWFSTKFIIQMRSLQSLQALGHYAQGQVKLRLERADRDLAQQAASQIRLQLSAYQLNQLEGQ
ncbi:MAG: hypothetical protein KME20_16355 [Kaiparowitsia implicata GSE-PSE-MK54-09C]|jgi:hypothetical protein|nr:hypothetical protein [Kaiparowitsia implicata GSE-PSE-MK54-09C]